MLLALLEFFKHILKSATAAFSVHDSIGKVSRGLSPPEPLIVDNILP